jgi:hypothetical protein
MRRQKTFTKTAPTRRSGAAAQFVDARLGAGYAAFPPADLIKHTGWSTTAAKSQWMRLGARVDPRPKELESFWSCASVCRVIIRP